MWGWVWQGNFGVGLGVELAEHCWWVWTWAWQSIVGGVGVLIPQAFVAAPPLPDQALEARRAELHDSIARMTKQVEDLTEQLAQLVLRKMDLETQVSRAEANRKRRRIDSDDSD